MLGDKIKMLRKSQGLNQTAFANRLFVTTSAVSQWETGRTIPDTERLMAMAKEFSVPLSFFSDDSNINSETELIKRHLLIELEACQPKTVEARIISGGVDKLPKEKREQILNVVRAMFANNPGLFEEKGDGKDES